ncbi:MAG: hypothetical protein HFG10_00890 [Oscillibacter sp.]|nr:hypothetical protein [Oscillibacter sp.]
MKIKQLLLSPAVLVPLSVLAVLLLFSDHASYRQEGLSMTPVEDAVTSRDLTVEVLNTTNEVFQNAGDYDPNYRLQRRMLGLWFPMRQDPAWTGGEGCMTLPTCYYEKDIPQRLHFQWSTDYRFPFASLYPGRYRLILDFYKQDGSYSYGPDFSLAAEFTVK